MLKLQDKGEDKELDPGSDEPEAPLPLTVTSRVSNFYMILILSLKPERGKNKWALCFCIVRFLGMRVFCINFPQKDR